MDNNLESIQSGFVTWHTRGNLVSIFLFKNSGAHLSFTPTYVFPIFLSISLSVSVAGVAGDGRGGAPVWRGRDSGGGQGTGWQSEGHAAASMADLHATGYSSPPPATESPSH